MMTEYQEDIWCALKRMYGLDFTFLKTEWVSASWFDLEWDGIVEVFAVHGHPEAVLAYAWAYDERGCDGYATQYIAFLRIAPILTPRRAVLACLMENRL
jgi:hypothetical protein